MSFHSGGTVMTSESSPEILSVSQLTEVIKHRLESDRRLINCYVAGEISNFKYHTSGHMYFTLKDEKSRIRAIMFASKNRNLPFLPEDGMRVICLGSIGVFDRDGQYQIYLDDMQPDGLGALYLAFAQLRDKLSAEGLFAEARKRALPVFPRRIGVVTSPTGAVIRDICSTLARRFPLAHVVLAPALVQGPGAAASIVSGIEMLTGSHKGEPLVDVLIVGRGGGSLEELWPFNEEVVARAVAGCPVPVISAVGHETDFTICDFVADVRAATPTAAAEIAAPHVQELRQQMQQQLYRARTAVETRLAAGQQRLTATERSPVLNNPQRIVDFHRQSLDYLEGQLRQYVTRLVVSAERRVGSLAERLYRYDIGNRIAQVRARVERAENAAREQLHKRMYTTEAKLHTVTVTLEALNPLTVLRRGYSVVYKPDQVTVVTSTKQLQNGERIAIRMQDGIVGATVVKEEERDYVVGEQSRLDI